jgi:Asp/Glu/hydantoin racemase
MTELGRFGRYQQALEKHVAAVAGEGVEVVLHGLRPGTYGSIPPAEVLRYPYAFHALLSQVIEHVQQAEREGYDAVAIASYTEPFVREARSVVDIPVASMAESTLLTGCSVARKSALITVSEDIVVMAERIIAASALERRVATVLALDPAVNEPQLLVAFDTPAPVLDSFHATARRAIAAHADVIIPAEGVLNELLVAQGVRDIDGVPVMDSVGVVLLHAEMLAKLHRRTGLHPGRRWDHPKPPPDLLDELRSRGGGSAS